MRRDPPAVSEGGGSELPHFPVVGIGASAGGLEALQKLLPHLRPTGAAFIVVQHLASGRESTLAQILARSTELPVETITGSETVERNHIYVAPPGVEVRIAGDRLEVQVVTAPPLPRRSIDDFLRSLALQRGRSAIGVVLSGIGSDGMLGLRAIKEQGGLTFAQDPATAGQTGMPQAALDAGVADFCLSPGAIGDELARLGSLAVGAAPADGSLERIVDLVRSTFGVDFAARERAAVEPRILRRMAVRRLETLTDYHALVQNDPQELALLYGELLLGAGGFFRDRKLFETLTSVVFPRVIEQRKADASIRVWVVGCATGEDVYSLAIALLEALGDRADGFKVQIFATDVDEESLGKARRALFPRSVEEELSPERLDRYFSLGDQGYRVNRKLRDLVVFARHGLAMDPPYSRIDLVSCSNVLVHLQPPLRRRILRSLHYALRPNGILVLGPSESVSDATELFDPLAAESRVFVKRSLPALSPLDLGGQQRRAEPKQRRPAGGPLPPQLQQIAERTVIERYAPPGMLVSSALEVLQFWGRTGRFL